MKKIKSAPNFSSNPTADTTYHLEDSSTYPSPEGVNSTPFEENIFADHKVSTYLSKDCSDILSQFDANINISLSEIQRPFIFESRDSWTYVDKRITVCFLPKKKIKQ
jgi:hypothetical protein